MQPELALEGGPQQRQHPPGRFARRVIRQRLDADCSQQSR